MNKITHRPNGLSRKRARSPIHESKEERCNSNRSTEKLNTGKHQSRNRLNAAPEEVARPWIASFHEGMRRWPTLAAACTPYYHRPLAHADGDLFAQHFGEVGLQILALFRPALGSAGLSFDESRTITC
jgi:hypothetical protein